MTKRTGFPFPPFTRRQFLSGALATGALTGMPAALLADARGPAAKPKKPSLEQRDYFFNFAHEADHQSATYYLLAGGIRVKLDRVQDHPGVLKQHRKKNRFLRNVPDDQLTHVVQNLRLSADFVTMSYVIQGGNTSAGTWNMSAMYFLPPMGGIIDAAALSVERAGSNPLPLSAKRVLYGHSPAVTAEDLIEEAILLDPSDHATAIIGMHPDLFSVEGTSGAIVHNHYIQPNGATVGLAILIQALGPATPQLKTDTANSNGWATLTPILDDNGQPFRNQNGKNKGLIQYHPDWNDPIRSVAQQGTTSVLPQIKQDASFGADVTSADPGEPGPSGALWKRHDGVTTIDQSPREGAPQDTLKFTLATQNIEGGFSTTGSAVDVNGTVHATLTFTNWFVRWLGIYLLFLDGGGVPVDPSGVEVQLPQDYDAPAGDRAALDQFAAMFALMLGPEFTVLGIPVASSAATVGFNLPPNTTTVRVFASGPALLVLGGVDPNDPTTWGDWLPGAACTLIINYGVTIVLMVAGACEDLSLIQKAALIVAPAIAKSLTAVLSDELRDKDFSTPDVWRDVAVSIGKSLLQTLLNKRSAQLLALITSAVAEGVAEDCIPIAGQIALGISLAAGAATLLETTLEIAASPVSYVYDLTLAHDITVTILHASNNDKFPAVATHYKVTAQFDRGATPYTQTRPMQPGAKTLPPVVFQNVPFGGKVTVTAGFYSSDDRLAGQGSTGPVANDVDTLPDIVIQEYPTPIRPNTTYEHKQVTILTDAQGAHGWQITPTGPTAKADSLICGQAAGDLCSLRDITVRQGTGAAPGFVGYAFQSFSSGASACGSGGQGQLDQLVNIGDVDPAGGYATLGCGLQDGTRISYSLFPGSSTGGGGPTPATSDFYLDTTNGVVRRVRLDLNPPQFDPPSSDRAAWGAFNLPSDALLMHPSGRLVSINNALHKIEILRLPDAPVSEAVAMTKLLATTHAGFGVGNGALPGLLGGPVAAAISPDGVILVLESLNNRIQAFDVGANPVQLFQQQTSRYFLELTATAGADTEYLDLAVEYTGYLYVLSRSQGTNLYRLDIYHPGQAGTAPIATTQNMNAAKLTVDFWRNVYTLNYDVLRLPGGGFPGVTEPSVSLWAPSTAQLRRT